MQRYLLVLVLSLALQGAYAATDLLTVYHQAQSSDPSFQAARATWLAAKESVPQALAALLPSVGIDASKTHNTVSLKQTDKTSVFPTKTWQLNVSQPVFDFSAWAVLGEARAQVKQAAANYTLAQQDLVLRVATAYFNVLLAEDVLRFTQAQKKALARQREQAEELYKVGLATITATYQARAGDDKVAADLITAQNNLQNAKEALRQITGDYYTALLPLRKGIVFPKPQPSRADDWVKSASEHNLKVVAARCAADVARATIRQMMAGHLPTVAVIGDMNKTNTFNAGLNRALDTDSRSIGVKMTIPMYQGGLVNSKIRQTKQQYLAAQDIVQQEYRAAQLRARQNYNNLLAQLSKIQADRQMILSNGSAVNSTASGYSLGANTIIEVLQTQQNLFQSQVSLATDQYAFINSLLNLKQAAGNLSVVDLQAINAWLTSTIG